jgi:S1-C subfamily serine protease
VQYVERDVSRDQAAAHEVVSRSGQMGVPVTIAGNDVIVGFDRAKLDALARRWKADAASPPKLGVAARDASGGGSEVGRVNAGEPAERAGVRPGDVVETVNDEPVRNTDELMRAVDAVGPGDSYTLGVRRGDGRVRVTVRP